MLPPTGTRVPYLLRVMSQGHHAWACPAMVLARLSAPESAPAPAPSSDAEPTKESEAAFLLVHDSHVGVQCRSDEAPGSSREVPQHCNHGPVECSSSQALGEADQCVHCGLYFCGDHFAAHEIGCAVVTSNLQAAMAAHRAGLRHRATTRAAFWVLQQSDGFEA